MRVKARILQDGTVVTEVLDRGEHLCDAIYQITNKMGTQVSDEELPDCPGNQAQEYQGTGGSQ